MPVRKRGASDKPSETSPAAESSAKEPAKTAKSTRSAAGKVVLYDKGTMVNFEPEPLPANRPVFQSNAALVPSENLPNARPILSSNVAVTSRDHLPHQRPVFRSELDIASMNGDRPIMRLDLPLAPSDRLPENRPIATGPWLEVPDLMGFLD
ncbi:MAG: hypothetical protein AAGB01_08290 [Cyanobacteria bacterium P01_F01_bin.42]